MRPGAVTAAPSRNMRKQGLRPAERRMTMKTKLTRAQVIALIRRQELNTYRGSK